MDALLWIGFDIEGSVGREMSGVSWRIDVSLSMLLDGVAIDL